jgi:regulator of RNase E activity RraA
MPAYAPLAPDTLRLLSEASTATISTQLFKLGLRNTFLFGLKPLNPNAARFAGEAVTLRYIPAREDLDVVDIFKDPEHPQRKAIEMVESGQVLVQDCRGQTRAASGGGILIERLFQRGCVGMVTDGSVRDSPEISEHALPVFSAGVSATLNLAIHHAVDINVPIGCAGVPVFPGDIIVADAEGVVCVPREYADQIAGPAAEQEIQEQFILEKIKTGVPLRGTYPPNEATQAEYAEWRRARD